MPQILSQKLNQFITDRLVTSLSDESCCSRVTQYQQSNSSYSTKNLALKIQELMQILKNTQNENMSLRIQQAELRKQLTITKKHVIQELIRVKNGKNGEVYYQESINQDFQQKNSREKQKQSNNSCKQKVKVEKNDRKWSNFGSLQQVPEEDKRIYRSYLNSPNKHKYIECRTNININNKDLKLKIEELQLSSNSNSNEQIFSPRKAGSISKTRRNLSEKHLGKLAQISNYNLQTDSTQRILNKNKNKQKNDSKLLVIPSSIDQIWNQNDSQKTMLKCGTRKIIKKNNVRKTYLE